MHKHTHTPTNKKHTHTKTHNSILSITIFSYKFTHINTPNPTHQHTLMHIPTHQQTYIRTPPTHQWLLCASQGSRVQNLFNPVSRVAGPNYGRMVCFCSDHFRWLPLMAVVVVAATAATALWWKVCEDSELRLLLLERTSSPTWAWKFTSLPAFQKRPTDRQTDRPTNRPRDGQMSCSNKKGFKAYLEWIDKFFM